MKKSSGMGRQCAAAVGLALLLSTGTIPAAHGDDGEDTAVVAVLPVPAPSEESPEPPVESPEPPVESPEPPVESPEPPVETTPVTAPEGITPETVPDPLQEPRFEAPAESETLLPPLIADGSANANPELVPTADVATPTAAPSITSEPSAAAVPVALPEPVTKTIDAVVATATGSPLYVQVLTVFALIGAGIAYFRVVASKGTRLPSKSVK